MTVRKLSVATTIKRYTNENGFAWGINTVMKSLAPGASLPTDGNTYKWNETNLTWDIVE
jgi:hypothetical protein